MTNNLVGDVYAKIIEEVVAASANDFEESGVGQATLNEMQQAWQHKLSQRQVALMPWDPRPEPPQRAANGNPQLPSAASNGITAPSYPGYENEFPAANSGNGRIKTEQGSEAQYQHMPSAGNYSTGSQQGGMVRAQQLVQQQFGAQAAASLNTMQRGGGLALPGQQAKPQGLQLPNPNTQHLQQQYSQQQHEAMQRQQQQLQQQQQQQNDPRIKVENNTPTIPQGQYGQPQRAPNPAYSQTDGADDDLEAWRAFMAQRRAVDAERLESADRMMRDRISMLSDELESGLMLPLDEHKARLDSRKRRMAKAKGSNARARTTPQGASSSRMPGSSVPQFDGDEDDDEDVKEGIKGEEDDDDAINSDLDDPDEEQNQIGEDDDELGDSILCTYDKVQRVKNKWKCTLKDGVLNTGGKEWLFHKGQGEYEW